MQHLEEEFSNSTVHYETSFNIHRHLESCLFLLRRNFLSTRITFLFASSSSLLVLPSPSLLCLPNYVHFPTHTSNCNYCRNISAHLLVGRYCLPSQLLSQIFVSAIRSPLQGDLRSPPASTVIRHTTTTPLLFAAAPRHASHERLPRAQARPTPQPVRYHQQNPPDHHK